MDSEAQSVLIADRRSSTRSNERGFAFITKGAALLLLVLLGAICLFLVVRAVPSLRRAGFSFFTETEWFPDADPPRYGIAALTFGTVVSSIGALLVAVPIAIGSSLFLVELAPPRLARWTGYLVDLLAAVPSVVYGLWGLYFLVPTLIPFERWLDNNLGFIPIFHSRSGIYGRSLFDASVILAIMVLPIIAALAREIFKQVPSSHREAALALGATKWEMIRVVVLPFGRNGVIGATMLGLGRALGETIAVALVLSASFSVNPHIVEPGGNTFAANIATKFGEAGAQGRQALIATGLVLFALTLTINAVARAVVYRTAKAKAVLA